VLSERHYLYITIERHHDGKNDFASQYTPSRYPESNPRHADFQSDIGGSDTVLAQRGARPVVGLFVFDRGNTLSSSCFKKWGQVSLLRYQDCVVYSHKLFQSAHSNQTGAAHFARIYLVLSFLIAWLFWLLAA
jgi:hypothetical protein